jgi:hypothetical protein
MAGLDDILKMLPIDDIASKLGVDPQVAAQAVQQGGGAILSGLQKNAETPQGSAAIEQALGKHSDTASGGQVNLDSIDTADGEKILGHVFGGEQQQVSQKLTDSPQTAGVDFGKLLPMLAPIVMGMLAKGGSSSSTPAAAPATGGDAGGGIGGLIGGLLGGGSGSGSGSSGGIDIGGMLGGLLGGSK